MSTSVRNRLEVRRREQIERTIEALLAGGEAADLKADLERIDAYSSLLTATEPKSDRNWKLAVAVGLLCFVAAGILWSIEIPQTEISMALETESLRATLSKAWRINDAFHSQRIHVERLSSIHAPNLGLAINHGSGDAWFELEGGQVVLQTLQLNGTALMELYSNRDELELYASRAPLTGRITVTGKTSVTAGPRAGEMSAHGAYQLNTPETVEFSVDIAQSVPSRLGIHRPDGWSLRAIEASDLSFAHEESRDAGERLLVSGVKRGTIRFNDTAWPVLETREGDLLGLGRTQSARIDARGENGLIHVTLNGPVGSVTVGGPGATKKLAPSYLEYLYNKKSLALFWGAVVFLWGLIWSVRNTILR